MPIREQQTTNKQHAIPQSIMSVEFKIIGDLTIKQFFFLMIFCGLAYVSFMLIPIFVIKWSFVAVFVLTGLAFAFVPLGDRGLDAWVINFFRAMFLPNQYVYRKDEEVPNVFLYQNLDVLKSELITLTPTSSRRKIEAYLEQQEVPEDKLDIDEKTYILKVKEAYATESFVNPTPTFVTPQVHIYPTPEPSATPAPEPYKSDYIIEKAVQQKKPDEFPALQNIPSPLVTAQKPEARIPESLDVPITPPVPVPTPVPSAPRVVMPVTPPLEVTSTIPAEEKKPQEIISTEKISPIPPATVVNELTPPQDVVVRSHGNYGGKKTKKHHAQSGYYSPSMTPDMHSGRRFINLSQEAARGEIILPIRGERVIGTQEEQKYDHEEEKKVEELDRLITQVKSRELVQRQIIEAQKIQESDEARKKRLVEAENMAREAAIVKQKQQQEQNRINAERENQLLREKEETLRKQKEELLKKQREEREEQQKKIQTEGVKLPPRVQPQPIPLTPAQTPDTPNTPNIVWGIVTTEYDRNKVPVPGVVIIIRNQKKEVVRAVKSNSQGKFGITTPLVNGSYTVEVDKEKSSGLNFEITAVEATGKVIPVMEVVGKA